MSSLEKQHGETIYFSFNMINEYGAFYEIIV